MFLQVKHSVIICSLEGYCYVIYPCFPNNTLDEMIIELIELIFSKYSTNITNAGSSIKLFLTTLYIDWNSSGLSAFQNHS